MLLDQPISEQNNTLLQAPSKDEKGDERPVRPQFMAEAAWAKELAVQEEDVIFYMNQLVDGTSTLTTEEGIAYPCLKGLWYAWRAVQDDHFSCQQAYALWYRVMDEYASEPPHNAHYDSVLEGCCMKALYDRFSGEDTLIHIWLCPLPLDELSMEVVSS